MILQKIIWPVEDSDDEDFDLEATCRITGFLRMFIETGIKPYLANVSLSLQMLLCLMDIYYS